MNILSISSTSESEVIGKAVSILRRGGLLIYPTETVYGAGVDATNKNAAKKLSLFKARPFGKPYSIAVSDEQMAKTYVELNTTARNLYKTFLPGPLTVISKGKHRVVPGIESETGTLGIRIPAYPLVINIVKQFGRPMTATSANAAWKKRPYQISDILDHISGKQKKLIALILDAGILPRREPSTVVDTTLDNETVLRQGDIRFSDENKMMTSNEQGTQNVAKELWQKYEQYVGLRPIVFALEGLMGAGKTIFTKGLAKAIGIQETVVSPTFNLRIDYQSKENPILSHVDAWRMESGQELMDIGFRKILSDKSILVIEWADRVVDVIREHEGEAIVVWVRIEYGISKTERWVRWEAR